MQLPAREIEFAPLPNPPLSNKMREPPEAHGKIKADILSTGYPLYFYISMHRSLKRFHIGREGEKMAS
jgi:hypothetical protein